MRRTHWLVATAIVIGGCGAGGGGLEVTAREIVRDSTAAALAEAAAEGDTARIRRLIAGGADPNARGRDGVTVSQWALLHQSPRGLAALLEGGADPTLADSSGETVVHYAAKTNVPEYLEILLAPCTWRRRSMRSRGCSTCSRPAPIHARRTSGAPRSRTISIGRPPTSCTTRHVGSGRRSSRGSENTTPQERGDLPGPQGPPVTREARRPASSATSGTDIVPPPCHTPTERTSRSP